MPLRPRVVPAVSTGSLSAQQSVVPSAARPLILADNVGAAAGLPAIAADISGSLEGGTNAGVASIPVAATATACLGGGADAAVAALRTAAAASSSIEAGSDAGVATVRLGAALAGVAGAPGGSLASASPITAALAGGLGQGAGGAAAQVPMAGAIAGSEDGVRGTADALMPPLPITAAIAGSVDGAGASAPAQITTPITAAISGTIEGSGGSAGALILIPGGRAAPSTGHPVGILGRTAWSTLDPAPLRHGQSTAPDGASPSRNGESPAPRPDTAHESVSSEPNADNAGIELQLQPATANVQPIDARSFQSPDASSHKSAESFHDAAEPYTVVDTPVPQNAGELVPAPVAVPAPSVPPVDVAFADVVTAVLESAASAAAEPFPAAPTASSGWVDAFDDDELVLIAVALSHADW